MKRTPSKEYRMSFTLGGLFLNESLTVARLHADGEAWEQTVVRALDQGATALPKISSNRRALREISNRLECLTDQERHFFLEEADRLDRHALLWLGVCRAYRFVREFAVEVIRERYLSYQFELPPESFDILFDVKAEWHESLNGISASTRTRLRQVLFRIMRESGIISNDRRIQTAILSPQLKALIADNNPRELAYFPGIPLMERNH